MAAADGLDVVGELDAHGDSEVEVGEVAACSRYSFAYRVEEHVRGLGEERRADPPVGELAGETEVGRAERGDVDRQVRGWHQGADGSAFAAGERQVVDLAVVVEPLAGGDGADDLDGLAGAAHGLVEGDAVPAFHDLRSAGSDAEDAPSARQRVQ